MIARYAFATLLAAAVTFGLLFIMQLLIATGQEAITEPQVFRLNDFVRIERNQFVEAKKDKPEKPKEPQAPPETPTPELGSDFDDVMTVSVSEPAIETTPTVAGVGFGVNDGDYLPIVKVSPVYPARALARKMEGYVLVEFTVTRTGIVKDVIVVESTAALFERPAIEAALKFKYKPRVIDGEAVEVAGVRNRITFEMAQPS